MPDIQCYTHQDLELKPDVPGAKRWAVALTHSMLTYFELEPNTVFPLHSHQSEQITLVLEGELTFLYGGTERTLKSGEVIAIPGNMGHSVRTGKKACKAVDAWSPIRAEYL